MLRSMGLQAAAGAAAAQRAIYCSRTLNLRSIQARTSLWAESRVHPDPIPLQAKAWVHMSAQFLLGRSLLQPTLTGCVGYAPRL